MMQYGLSFWSKTDMGGLTQEQRSSSFTTLV